MANVLENITAAQVARALEMVTVPQDVAEGLTNIYGKVDTEIAAIKTVADNIYGKVDTEVAAVKTETDKITAIKAVTDVINLDQGILKVEMADTTVIPNNSQAAEGLLATAEGDVLIEEIIVQRGAVNAAGPTNYRFSTDNVNGLTGKAAPVGSMILAKFNAQKTSILSLDGTVKQLPFVLEDGKKLYIDGDDAATTGAVGTNFYIKYKALASSGYLA